VRAPDVRPTKQRCDDTTTMSDTDRRVPLPIGRLLYREADTMTHVVVQHVRSREHWIVEEGWSGESEAAGPFSPDDLLRAVRLANTSVPDGCELGPWQSGIRLFGPTRLPGHSNDWTRVETAWLSRTVTLYSESDITQVTNETCCEAPKDIPRVRVEPSLPTADLDALVRTRAPGLQLRCMGVLRCPWNAHPEGSPVYSRSIDLDQAFAAIDLPH
jgi:hypothetical protein